LYAAPRSAATAAPQSTVIIADTTFWGQNYGVTVFRSPTLKKNLWWSEVASERVATYYYGKKILEGQGWTCNAAVVDGRRGLARVFHGLPVQICIFHQVKTVTRYLTRRPQTQAGQELRAIALRLKDSNEKEFTKLLDEWCAGWKDFINEKTRVIGCNRWHYTHKNVRSAYLSLKRNLPYLFTYQKYPEFNIPSTTNSLDGMFSQLKNKIAVHRGIRRDRRYRIISEILSR
jgi:transposase-like protein